MNRKEKMDTINTLHIKRESVGLTESEEKQYCELNSELSGYPEKVFTKEFTDKLDNAIKETDKFLKSVKIIKINYKKECLKINDKLKASKVSGCAYYHIITGSRLYGHKSYSSFQDTISLAWKDCYLRFTQNTTTHD